MNYLKIRFKHVFKWILKFIKFPNQFIKLFFQDLKIDYINQIKFKHNFIFVVGLPKSGSTLIENILKTIGYVDMTSSPLRYFFIDKSKNPHDISEELFQLIPKNKPTFLKLHTHYNEHNMGLLNKYNPKIIFSFRNLHDVLISRYNHILSDKKHRHHNLVNGLDLVEGFKKSLTVKNTYDTPDRPIDYFSDWIDNWKKEISSKKLNVLILNYEDYENDKIKYISEILNYLEIRNFKANEIIRDLEMKFDTFNKNNLEKNLTAFIKPQTMNINSREIKKKLRTPEIKRFIENQIKNKSS